MMDKDSKCNNIITIILVVISVFVVIFGYSIFNGIPFGKYIAKAKIENYVKQVYNITDVSIPKYNIENSDYYAIIQKNSNFEITYNLRNNTIDDERVQNAYSKQLVNEYDKLKKSYNVKIRLPFTVEIYTTIIAKGNYSRNFLKIPCYQKIDFMELANYQKISSANSIKMPAVITKDVLNKLSNVFNITSTRVRYTDLNGVYEINVIGKDKLTVDEMQKHTTKMARTSESERDRKLIHELNK
ncbi:MULTISPECIES: YfjL-like protein [Clostridium]|uniref:YfjL-like N-terminal domain-containing protein n=1 Tax=Clostridium frigoriphilum TaxID=443253 RepID=A0ABU7UQY1_9CLOT|nr:hypothetical protein [Clostridium sp. DSM 17811]MBU3100761.1 hypothetical protein [Clostridium sp. DSM 17811]